jgi:hypothetical protein
LRVSTPLATGECQLTAVVVIVLGCPFEHVGAGHPRREVWIPLFGDSHPGLQLGVGGSASPVDEPVGVDVHPMLGAT